jgi:NAD(P)-dependent dehydrogenase (short-subunit alcohol dehydrogenase family)
VNKQLLAQQVAIVTGAGRGIGRAAALTLAQAGAAVIVAARSAGEITSVADEIKHSGGQALAIPTDVSDVAQVDHLLILTMRAFGRIDILVNNAALIHPLGKVWETAPTAWSKLIAVNVIGPYLCSRAVLPHMLDRGSGRIINVSSGAAERDIEGASAYCASKAALERFSSTLAAEVAHTAIKVTTLRPGVADTAMQSEIRQTSRQHFPRVAQWHTLHRKKQLRPPTEPAQAILWLASPFAATVEQHLFNIDDEAFRAQIVADLNLKPLPGRERE